MKNKIKSFLRYISPFINVFNFIHSIKNIVRYPVFFIDFFKYKFKYDKSLKLKDIYPMLNDKTSKTQTGGGQYFYQDNWALRKIYQSKIKKHVDVGSRIDGFVSQCAVFTNVEFIDFRPVDYKIPNLTVKQGTILNLPFTDRSIDSLSCLHVIEHIGLGRYGDPVDAEGSIKALKELQRVLAIGGVLYIGVPIGRERVMFNAHRIFNPQSIINVLSDLKLIEFCAVDDKGYFIEKPNTQDFDNAEFSLGLFFFTREKNIDDNS